MVPVAHREDALLGARLLLVAPGAAEAGIEAVPVQGVLERLGLHDVRVLAAAVGERRDVIGAALLVGVDDEVQMEFAGDAVPEGDHVAELPGGVHMQQREWQLAGVERLARQMQQHRRVLADGIQQHRALELRRHLADDVDALRFQLLEMCERVSRHADPRASEAGDAGRVF